MKEKQDELNLKDILFYCLSHWYIFLVTGIIIIISILGIERKGVNPTNTVEEEEAQEIYERAVQYSEDSLLLNMNPLEVNVDTLSYRVILDDNGDVPDYEYVKALVCQFESFVESGTLAQRTADAILMDKDVLNEVLSVKNDVLSFVVKIRSNGDLNSKAIVEEVKHQIEIYSEEMQQNNWNFKFQLLGHANKEIVDTELISWQNNVINYIQTMNHGQNEDTGRETVKKAVLLLALDFVLVIAILLTVYLYNGTMRNSLQIKKKYDLNEIGCYMVNGGKAKNIRRLRYSEVIALDASKCAQMLAMKIAVNCTATKIFLTSSSADRGIQDVLALSIEKLKEKGISAEYIGEIQKKPDEIEKIVNLEKKEIILVEKIGTSRLNDIDHEIDLYEKCKIEAQKIVFLC